MKKSQVISLVVMFVIVTILIIVGLFKNDNTILNVEPKNTISNSSAPSKSLNVSSSTPQKSETTSNPTPSPTAVSGQPVVFPVIDKDKLANLSTLQEDWGVSYSGSVPIIPFKILDYITNYGCVITQNSDKKVIYLTFDEGYENGFTSKILDTLKAKNIKAIFFITGSYIDLNPDLVKRMVDEGHLVGNHTNQHKIMPTLGTEDFTKELLDLEVKFRNVVGQDKRMTYYRPPEGSYSERDLAAAKQLGYKLTLWSFAYVDYDTENQKGADSAYNTIISKLHNGGVFLLHAVSKDNAEVLGRLIDDVKAQGYEINRIDQ